MLSGSIAWVASDSRRRVDGSYTSCVIESVVCLFYISLSIVFIVIHDRFASGLISSGAATWHDRTANILLMSA